jgi:transcriptional regulator with XRE-family HTH domain
MNAHWTSQSTKDFVYRISSDFALQIEKKMDAEPITQAELANRVGVSPGRVSQVLRNPGNMTLGKMVEYARAMGLKVAIVAYDDGDAENTNGPINSQIFDACWKKAGKPTDFFSLTESTATIRSFVLYVQPVGDPREKESVSLTTQLGDIVWQNPISTPKSLNSMEAR